MHIAQPALSRTIIQLESEVGLQLLERNNRKVALTVAGRAFLDGCYEIQMSVRDSVTRAHQAQAGQLGQLVIDYTDFAIMGFLPRILKEFRQKYPNITVVPVHGVTAAQLKNLAAGKLMLDLLPARWRCLNSIIKRCRKTGLSLYFTATIPWRNTKPFACPIAQRVVYSR